MVCALSLVFAIEPNRWIWALFFSLGWGAILAGVGYWAITVSSARPTFDFPFWSGLLATAIALPIFQTIRDRGRFKLPYQQLHGHAWSDTVCWLSALLFVGLSFALAYLLAALFNLIGLDFIRELLKKDWFTWMFMGASFGASLGVLKENHGIIAHLQNLVMTVLSILAPAFGISLVLFLALLPLTGLQPLWDATRETTPILLSCAVGAILLSNSIIRSHSLEVTKNKILRYSAIGLAGCILPLAVIAIISMQQRISQYGITPDRIWGLIAIAVAITCGVAYLASLLIGRSNWMEHIRANNTRLAIALCALTVFLAMPIIDFGGLAVTNQLARLADGRTKPNELDFAAFAYDFGPKGRKALEALLKSNDNDLATGAKIAFATENRWSAHKNIETAKSTALSISQLKVFPESVPVPRPLMDAINNEGGCIGEYCLLIWSQGDKTAKLVTSACAGNMTLIDTDGYSKCPPTVLELYENGDRWEFGKIEYSPAYQSQHKAKTTSQERDAEKSSVSKSINEGEIEIRAVERRQLFIGGRPVGKAFK